ncbi:hypothetical protein D3C81_1572760 [compost metagenome]
MQVIEYQLTHDIRGIASEQPQFQTDERDRQIGPHCATEDTARIGTQPGRDIHRCYWLLAGIDRGNGASVRIAHIASQASAKQCIQHDATQFGLCRPGRNGHFFGHRLGMGRRRIALQTRWIADRQHPD